MQIRIYDLKKLAKERNMKLDGKCYGIYGGMIMRFDTFHSIYSSISLKGKLIHPSPTGFKLTQNLGYDLIKESRTINILCSRYDGIDSRIVEHYSALEICIGDYVIFDGDTACMVIINMLSRLSFSKDRSLCMESFTQKYKLEHDQYTGPRQFEGLCVPSQLLTGNHKKIEEWCKNNSETKTRIRRPDLIAKNGANNEI